MARILVIDDDRNLLEAVAEFLEASGHEVVTAPDGETGLRLARERLPDLVLSDVRMADVDGYEVVRRLQEDAATAAVPVILMTGYADQRGMRQAMELGAEDYLAKPFGGRELVQTIEARLRRREAVERRAERQVDRIYSSLTVALPHELRTPLTAILAGARLLSDPDALPGPERVAEIASAIRAAGERLHRLLERFLAYAQIHLALSRPPDDRTPAVTANPGTVVAAVARRLAAAAGREADLEVRVEDAPAAVDARHLERVTEEIVDNALKFSHPGQRIRVVAGADRHRWELTVEDEGVGIRPEQVAELAAGVQLERALREQQGAGLGLGIARGICHLSEGNLRIEPRPEGGTRVTVAFPLSEGPDAPSA